MIFCSGEMVFSIRRLKNVVAELCHPTIYKVGSFGGERTVGQRTAIDGYGEDARSHAGTNAHGGILDDDGLPGLQPAGFLQPDEIGVGGGPPGRFSRFGSDRRRVIEGGDATRASGARKAFVGDPVGMS